MAGRSGFRYVMKASRSQKMWASEQLSSSMCTGLDFHLNLDGSIIDVLASFALISKSQPWALTLTGAIVAPVWWLSLAASETLALIAVSTCSASSSSPNRREGLETTSAQLLRVFSSSCATSASISHIAGVYTSDPAVENAPDSPSRGLLRLPAFIDVFSDPNLLITSGNTFFVHHSDVVF